METTDLIHPDLRTFETSFVQLRQLLDQSKTGIDELIRILDFFDADQVLPGREKGRRIGLIVEVWKPTGKDLNTIARKALAFSPTTRNALLGHLPPELQREVYKSAVETNAVETTNSSIVQDSATAAVSLANQKELHVEADEGEAGRENKIVLLLGAAEKHETNILFLKANRFEPLRAGSLKDRDDLLDNTLCGIVVDGSWWALLSKEQHVEELKKILGYSTFTFVRIDSSGLSEDAAKQMSTFAREMKFREPLASEWQWGVSRLTRNDVDALNEAASLLSTSQICRFHPGEIDESEGVVLLAAVKRKVKNRHPLNGIEVERVSTSLLPGGRTNARVFMLKPNDRGAPFVAKIDAIPLLRDEMVRFAKFISHRENWLKPELHTHGKIGMILFSLVEDVNKGDAPAPTLEACLRELSGVDRGLESEIAMSHGDLTIAVQRTIAKLVGLNSDPCTSVEIPNYCWLGIEPFYKMRENGVTYSIRASSGELDLIGVAEKALLRIERLNGKATVHGDLHGRNVLVRDREPHLVDYAYTGPGHPCFDLVRFESSLVFQHLRMTVEESRLESCFTQMFIEGAGLEKIVSDFPGLCSSDVNAVVLEAAISARKSAIEVLTKYGGDVSDYLAVKFVVACQALTMSESQAGVVRALIKALAPWID